MKKMLLLVNPCAGVRRANRFLTDIVAVFNRAGYEVTAYITAAPGDGAAVAQRYAPNVDLIVCCGGDGTFNETVSGVLRSGAGTPLGYIPSGSTNDFAASLHLSTHPVRAARDIVEGTPHPYDVGRFGSRYFTYVASFGAFTRTSYSTPQNVKNALGHTAYLLEGIQELSQIKPVHVRLELDTQTVEDDFLFGAISNSTSVGGILTLDPKQVDLCDGKFELLLVRAPKTAAELPECIRALRTQKYNCNMITFLSTEQVRVFAAPNMDWTLDGEREPGRGEIPVQNLHRAIRLMQKG